MSVLIIKRFRSKKETISPKIGFRPPNLPSREDRGPCLTQHTTWDHTSVPAKWHLIPVSGFSGMHKRDRQTDGRTDRARIYLLQQAERGITDTFSGAA